MIEKIYKFFVKFWQTQLSVLKILLQSKWYTCLPDDLSESELLILGNGPSLNNTLEKSPDFISSKILLSVNFFVTSPLFEKLKPQLYLIVDPLFWLVEANREKLFRSLIEKTKWPLLLFIPKRAVVDKKWQDIIKQNVNIKVFIYNTTPIEGFYWFTYWAFRKGLGMPRPHNVLIPSISIGLRLPFKKIYLAGADHSWLSEISVTDQNVVLVNQKHFYDTSTSRPAPVSQENLQSSPLYTIMYHLYVTFASYFEIEKYAQSMHKNIINITPNSYIDAFKKMKL